MSDKNPFTIESGAIRDNDLTGKYKKSWVEEAIDFEEGDSRLTISHTQSYLGSSITSRRLVVLFGVCLVGILIIFGRSVYLQVVQGDHYRALAEGNRIRLQSIPAERGILYDRYRTVLVQNVPGFSLSLSPQDLPRDTRERNRVIDRLVEMSGVERIEIERLVKKYGTYSQTITLKENLDYDTALKLYIENATLPGVRVESTSERSYYGGSASSSPSLLSLSHILGYVNKLTDAELDDLRSSGYLLADKIGRVGVEKTYETALRGVAGRKKIEVNSLGREQSVLAVDPPIPGKDIILSIDVAAQKKMEDLVRAMAVKLNKRKISAIAMNPTNGEVLALVSWPAYENNKFSQGIDTATYKSYIEDTDKPLFNRVIGGSYPPGSTAKIMVAVAAIQEKVISRYTTVNSVGGFMLGGTFFRDWRAGGHGITDVKRALAWSVNTFFYYIGGGRDAFTGLGIDRINDYFKRFHLAQKTGIDIPGESEGFIPSKEWKQEVKNETWYVGDTYNVAIGQGDTLVSPLQVALWTATVANNGTIVTPHVGQKITDPVTKKTTILEFPTSKLEGVSGETLGIVREGMRDCVVGGSCQLLSYLPFQAAGKTGTAQWNRNKPTHAWFTSFAPYRSPKIVVTVLVEEGGEGSVAAMPIAKDFLAWWGANYLE
jgi:penicillin-binding protein 2